MEYTLSNLSASNYVDTSTQMKIENSPHYSEGEFNNSETVMNWSMSDMASSAWEFFFNKNNRTPTYDLPRMQVDLSHFIQKESNVLNVTWLGHSSLLINIDGYRVITDPVFEKRISIFGPTRFNGDVPLDVEQIPQLDVVVISHDHYDHLNKYSIRQLIDKTKMFLVPLGVGARIVDWGVPRNKIVELDWWEEYSFNKDLKFISTPVQHFSGRGLTDRNTTLAASWVITTANHNIYYGGDSGYFDGFKLIGDKYGPFDTTFIECGAYNEKWADIHMFPEETVQAHLDLKGEVLHPIHWGTFNLALHPWYEPMERLTAAVSSHNIDVALPVVGETTLLGKYIPVKKWWVEPMNKQIKDAIKHNAK